MRLVILQPVLADYRVSFYERLFEHYGSQLQCISGEFADTKKTIGFDRRCQRYTDVVRNRYFLGGRLLWQSDVLGKCSTADVLVANFNIRHLSTWLILALRRILGRRTILWGHVEGRSKYVVPLRWLNILLADAFVTYTARDLRRFKEKHPYINVFVAPNSCVLEEHCEPHDGSAEKINNIIYVGRLVESKKVGLLVEGFLRFIAEVEDFAGDLVIIGDGPERSRLERLCELNSRGRRVVFRGHVTDPAILSREYQKSYLSCCPGYAGLSVLQSFAYGVPMVIADREDHSPEIEYARERENCVWFESDSVQSLVDTLKAVHQEKTYWLARSRAISDNIKHHYTIEKMALGMIEAINHTKI